MNDEWPEASIPPHMGLSPGLHDCLLDMVPGFPRVNVMVNFMRQFEWAIRYPEIWSNIILDVSVKVILEEINI